MMSFTPLNILVREIVNGTMALSALLLLIVFGRYIWHNRGSIWDNDTTQAAVAIMVLLTGHFMRASSSWVEFILLDMGVNTTRWLQWTWIWFMFAVVGIVAGKILMLNMFAPKEWRNATIYLGVPTAILIPVLIAFSLAG